jgi:hypothetical protein
LTCASAAIAADYAPTASEREFGGARLLPSPGFLASKILGPGSQTMRERAPILRCVFVLLRALENFPSCCERRKPDGLDPRALA